MNDEVPIKRWTAKRKLALFIDIFKGETKPLRWPDITSTVLGIVHRQFTKLLSCPLSAAVSVQII
jgi:hypothetical protein